MNVLRSSVFVCLALGALTACSKPASNWAKEQAPAPSTPSTPAVAQSQAPLPDLPAWASAYMGKTAKEALPEVAQCMGSIDMVGMKYVGAKPGTKVWGWAWDSVHAKPVSRVLLVDSMGTIVGAGETGMARPDVTKALPSVTSGVTGWQASTQLTTGTVNAIGIVGAKTGCPLPGHLALQ